jgi:hypothetical protein
MITSVKLPSKSGEVVDIALGFDTIEGIFNTAVHQQIS